MLDFLSFPVPSRHRTQTTRHERLSRTRRPAILTGSRYLASSTVKFRFLITSKVNRNWFEKSECSTLVGAGREKAFIRPGSSYLEIREIEIFLYSFRGLYRNLLEYRFPIPPYSLRGITLVSEVVSDFTCDSPIW